MIELDPQDLLWATRRLPRAVRDILKTRGPKVFLAGGYIRSCIAQEEVNDIDLFASTKVEADFTATDIAAVTGKGKIETPNAFTIRTRPVPTQVIHRWTFDSPEAALESFDFTVAKAAIWWDPLDKEWKSLAAPTYYSDLAAKRLVYTEPDRNEDAGGSILRVLKFYQRGYRITLDSLGAVIARLCEGVTGLKFEGHKVNLATVLTGLLREVDPLVDPDHIAHLPASDQPVNDIPF